jgi:hypothetical protein
MAEDGGDASRRSPTTSSNPPLTSSNPSLTSSYTGNDSEFMDFMHGVARKSNIFGGDSSIITNSIDKGSSSFSLLTSRFTDDKYLTPSTVEQEEYRELVENGLQVEADLENVLGRKDAYGSLPPPTYKYVLCCVALCCAVLHCVLCCVVLRCAALCCVVLRCVALCCIVCCVALRCVALHSVLYCVLCCGVLRCVGVYCAMYEGTANWCYCGAGI